MTSSGQRTHAWQCPANAQEFTYITRWNSLTDRQRFVLAQGKDKFRLRLAVATVVFVLLCAITILMTYVAVLTQKGDLIIAAICSLVTAGAVGERVYAYLRMQYTKVPRDCMEVAESDIRFKALFRQLDMQHRNTLMTGMRDQIAHKAKERAFLCTPPSRTFKILHKPQPQRPVWVQNGIHGTNNPSAITDWLIEHGTSEVNGSKVIFSADAMPDKHPFYGMARKERETVLQLIQSYRSLRDSVATTDDYSPVSDYKEWMSSLSDVSLAILESYLLSDDMQLVMSHWTQPLDDEARAILIQRIDTLACQCFKEIDAQSTFEHHRKESQRQLAEAAAARHEAERAIEAKRQAQAEQEQAAGAEAAADAEKRFNSELVRGIFLPGGLDPIDRRPIE